MSRLTIGDKDTKKFVKICRPPLKYINRVKFKKKTPSWPPAEGRKTNYNQFYRLQSKNRQNCVNFEKN